MSVRMGTKKSEDATHARLLAPVPYVLYLRLLEEAGANCVPYTVETRPTPPARTAITTIPPPSLPQFRSTPARGRRWQGQPERPDLQPAMRPRRVSRRCWGAAVRSPPPADAARTPRLRSGRC